MALHHASSGEPVSLAPLGVELHRASTMALVKAHEFEAIRLILEAGRELPAHSVSGQFTLHCLEGRVAIGLADSSLELAAHDWVYFDAGVTHSVQAIEDSSLLLTIILSAAGTAAG